MTFADDNPLQFYSRDLSSFLRQGENAARTIVDSLPEDQMLSTSEAHLQEHVVSRVSIDPIILHEDRAEKDAVERDIDVSGDPRRDTTRDGPLYVKGIQVTVSIPYSGQTQLWGLKPSRYTTVIPRGRVVQGKTSSSGTIEIRVEQASDDDSSRLADTYTRNVDLIRQYLEWQRTEIEQFNSRLPGIVSGLIEARKKRISANRGIVDSLKIPLRRRSDAPDVQAIPIKRRLVRPLSSPQKRDISPEPGIVDADYDHILAVIRHAGISFEATPCTLAKLNEEDIRNLVLANLNTHYEGGATGETFRKYGKTDIRIEDNNRSAFVAECKVWSGPKAVREAIDQLVGYLTWRDCKAALVIFNKHIANFSDLIEKVPSSILAHPSLQVDGGKVRPGEWKYVLTADQDAGREVYLRVMVFDLYCRNDSPSETPEGGSE